MRDSIARRLADHGWCNPPAWTDCSVRSDEHAAAENPMEKKGGFVGAQATPSPVPTPTPAAQPTFTLAELDEAARGEGAPPQDDYNVEQPLPIPTPAITPAPIAGPAFLGSGWYGALAFGALLAIYFFPSLNATGRKHHNAGAIFILNLLLGWTLVGWVVALVWSSTNQRPQTIIVHAPPPDPPL